jgi:nitrogen fixation protein NifU and related proteins
MDIYREIILDHYKRPRNFGHLVSHDAKMEEGNVTCGDRIVMEIKGKNVIEEIKFSGEGCAISIASASMLTEKVKEMNMEDVTKLTADDIMSMLGTTLTPSRIKCATLSLEVLKKAIWTITTRK